jgi:hypothetical protein
MRSTFYVALHTRTSYDLNAYTTAAGTLVNLFQDIFLDRDSIAHVTKDAPLTACHSNVEVVHEDAGLVGRLVVDMDAPVRVQLEKSKLTALLKAGGHWPGMKVEKRAVYAEPEDVEG